MLSWRAVSATMSLPDLYFTYVCGAHASYSRLQ